MAAGSVKDAHGTLLVRVTAMSLLGPVFIEGGRS